MSSEDLFPSYSLSERRLDQAVHVLGVAWGLTAVPLLLVFTDPWGDAVKLVATLLYCIGLLWVLMMSAAYNIVVLPGAKEVLRRLDHSGIFLLIAGSYSPFALVKIGGALGITIFACIWTLAVVGLFLSLRYPRTADRASLVLCLAMGWSVVFILVPLIYAVSTAVLVLLLVGGLLYTAGVGFHLAKGLRFHNAIWHAFVLAAAVCQYVAVYLAMRA